MREWLEADGLGGFASGTVAGIRTRRYHALLLTATTPPTGRIVLVNGFDAWVETPAGRFAISSQQYGPDVDAPGRDGRASSPSSSSRGRAGPSRSRTGRGSRRRSSCRRDSSAVAVSWKAARGDGGGDADGAALPVRPRLPLAPPRESGLPIRRGRRSRGALRFTRTRRALGRRALERRLQPTPDWYRNFLYAEERARGLDFYRRPRVARRLPLRPLRGEAVCSSRRRGTKRRSAGAAPTRARGAALRRAPPPRARSPPARSRRRRLHRAARRRARRSSPGYPWFTDWGRDTFIALRGLCLATGRLDEARQILVEWAGAVSEGMLPNLFPDTASEPEYNSVDASLWYVVAVYDYFEAMAAASAPASRSSVRAAPGRRRSDPRRATLRERGTGSAPTPTACSRPGEPGVQLTWMDAKVGDWVVTPRIGKPVEVQALWINALWIAGAFSERWRELHDRALASFDERFWNEAGGCLYDVVDCDHAAGTVDATFRPNQIFAVGGLPFALLEGERARRVVDAVEAALRRRSDCGRSRRTTRPTPDGTRAARCSATAPTTRERSGRGWRVRSSRRGCGCGAVRPRRGRGPRAVPRAAPRPPRRGGPRPRLRDRRRRRAAHAARLPLPGLVRGRAAAHRPGHPGQIGGQV